MTDLIVLKQNKEGYQPTDQEIVAYGQYLGLSFPEDEKFKPLLREALVSPLPPGWQACQTADQNQNLVFRNIKTQQIQQEHPLDSYYMEKIKRLKNLTLNLPIQTILQERDSWLKQSSEIFGPSRNSGDYSLKDQQFINQIQEQRSLYDEEQNDIQNKKSSRQEHKAIITRTAKTPRIYRRKKQQIKMEDIKERLVNFYYVPIFGRDQIEKGIIPQFRSEEQKNKLNEVQSSLNRISAKQKRLLQLQRQKKQKMEQMSRIKNKLKLSKF